VAKTQFLPIPIINLNSFEEDPNWSENMASKTKKNSLKDIESLQQIQISYPYVF